MKLNSPTGLLLFATLSSCNLAYRSTVSNTPLFSGKKELNLTATPTNVQAAYSVSNHVGIMANGFFEQKKLADYEMGYGGRGYMAELGAGYFGKLYKRPEVIAEIYGGVGYGHLFLTNNDTAAGKPINRTLDAGGMKFFIQPALGFKQKRFEISGSLRYTNVNYFNVTNTNWTWPDIVQDKLANLASPTFHFLEPAVTVRIGLRNVKLQFQYMYCIKLNPESIKYNRELFSVGLFIKIHTGTYYSPLQERRL